MYYLAAFWGLFILFIILYISSKWNRSLANTLDEIGTLFFMVLGSLVILAIATKDPVAVAGIEIPMELQWLGSLFVTGFGTWYYYLNPLKKKVYRMDRELGEVKTGIDSLKESLKNNTQLILNMLIKKKRL